MVGTILTVARLHIDIVGPLPPSNGFRYLVTIIDRFTRWSEVIPVVNISSETVCRALITGLISRCGVPSVLISDRSSQFESSLWSPLMSELNVSEKQPTTSLLAMLRMSVSIEL